MRKYARRQLVAVAVMISSAFISNAQAAGSTPDVSFGSKGVVLANKIVPKSDTATAVIPLADGKSLVLGTSGLLRLTAEGVLDVTFGVAGKVDVDVTFGATSFARNGDGQLLVIGEIASRVMRFNSDGSRDTNWGTNGVINLPFDADGYPMFPQAIVVSANGGFFIGGWVGPTAAIVAFHADGSLDAGFGVGGIATVESFAFAFGNIGDNQQHVSIVQDGMGRLVLATSTSVDGDPANLDFGVARFTSAGVLDTSFNNTGFQMLERMGADYLYAIALDSDGSIVIGGDANDGGEAFDGRVARLKVDGSIDVDLDEDGWLNVDYADGELSSSVDAIVVESDKIVVAGSTYDANRNRHTGMARHLANGRRDRAFSDDGMSVIYSSEANDRAQALRVDASGRYLLVGSAQRQVQEDDYSIARVTSQGMLDSTFADNGSARIGFHGNGAFSWMGLHQQHDGKFIGLGYLYNGRQYVESMARYRANGHLDTSFGDHGWVQGLSTEHGQSSRYFRNAVQHADGSIVACGELTGQNSEVRGFFYERYNAAGQRLPSFGREVDLSPWSARGEKGGLCRRVVAMADGSTLLAVHGCSNEAFVIKLRPDGALDEQFANGGVYLHNDDPDWLINASADGLVQLPDGKLLVGGRYQSGESASYDYLSFRLHANGTLDTTYNGTGSVLTDINNDRDVGSDIVMLPDGRFEIGGYSVNHLTQEAEYSAARFHANGSLDTSFHGDGKFSTALSASAYAWHLAVSATGKTTLVGFSSRENGDNKLAWVRLRADGTLDKAFSPTGKLERDYLDYSDSLNAVFHQANGKILSAGSCGGRACLIRLMGDASAPFVIDASTDTETPVDITANIGSSQVEALVAEQPPAAIVDVRRRCLSEWQYAQRLPLPQRVAQLANADCRARNH